MFFNESTNLYAES